MCELLKIQEVQIDSLKVERVFEQSFYPYLENIDPEKIDKIFNKVYFRFQRNCPEFRAILNRMYPPKDDVAFQKTEPVSEMTSSQLADFKKQKRFTYKEVDGEVTEVELKNDQWIDHFIDQTFSKLRLEWISDHKFQLTFIDSNNLSRSNFSFPGDKIIYKVLAKKEGYYLLSVNIEGQEEFEIFKLYFL
ncbi:hypothetical protein LZ575_19740 [Antarcticibacterium sp. 1MA-6-2]|uniref:hypothetical protein n=1 Tax=Antarcticibacterium sp. 1MA-6-2 TaxID=2908210 RepID=UPI001F15FB2B|nr:hypothetical protein [Antarcticibacterium sp. 1MA-6-2]UJH90906.1 hypothetical protein LZ575_19740 [Antarcticibacterium sp. 1MA-6-2]